MFIEPKLLKPKSTILIIGAPCTGKSTITRELLKILQGTYLVGETDIIRQILRDDRERIYNQIINSIPENKRSIVKEQLQIDTLKRGLSEITENQLFEQNTVISESMYDLVEFAHRKNRSFIGEGVNIDLCAIGDKLNAYKQMYVFSLSFDSIEEYRERYESRYGKVTSSDSKFLSYWRINSEIRLRATELQRSSLNVCNIQIDGQSTEQIVNYIIDNIRDILL